MTSQKGFMHITGLALFFVVLVVALFGWAILRGIEWLWPFIKALIHGSTSI